MKTLKQSLAFFLSCSLMLGTAQGGFAAQADQSTEQSPAQAAQQTPEELQQLAAPIALYADALVAQILAASTYPAEVVEADRWMLQHSDLEGEKLAQEVNKQHWDPSVKALAQFPSVLANMDKNISWTSALGDAYVNQEEDVLNAVQVMRQRAQNAGNLKSTPQQTVTTQGPTIAIEPADPEVVYVPAYDPWLVYGAPLLAYPGWVPVPGLFIGGPGISFGLGFGAGFFGGFGWGWNSWGFDWGGRRLIYNHNTYISRSRTFVNRNNFYHGRADFNHGRPEFNRNPGFHGGGPGRNPGSHGFESPHGQRGAHSGAFSGFDHGGIARGYSSRGRSSFGGGFHGGGGSHGGGGFHGGGGRR